MIPLILTLLLSPAEKTPKPGKPDGPRYSVTVSPRILMPPPAQPDLVVRARVSSDREEDYCAQVELVFNVFNPEARVSSMIAQDCPAWSDYRSALAAYERCSQLVVVCPPGQRCWYDCKEPPDVQTEWTWSSHRQRMAFGPGRHEVLVRFTLANGASVVKVETFSVPGGEAER